jgi:hypothetical protein
MSATHRPFKKRSAILYGFPQDVGLAQVPGFEPLETARMTLRGNLLSRRHLSGGVRQIPATFGVAARRVQ